MSKSCLRLNGSEFRDLATKVTKFPGLGMFGGSDLVHLSAREGWFKAATSGVVLAIGQKRCEDKLPLCAIDERVLVNFAGIVPTGGQVKIEIVGKELRLRCGRNEVTSQLIDGTDYTGPDVTSIPRLKIGENSAQCIRYLADIAYNDVTRPELCCVMLGKTGQAYAMDQKAVAVLRTGLKPKVSIPLPLALARAVEAGNSLYVSEKTTVLRAGWVSYSMPSLVAAAKSYPFAMVKTLQKGSDKSVGTVDGSKLAGGYR